MIREWRVPLPPRVKKSDWECIIIMLACPCNIYPLTPHFYIVKLGCTGVYIFSSPEPLGSQGELIVYPCSGVRRRPSVVRPSTISNIFSSETAWPIKAKFYVEPPWEGGTKVCINGPGHMTKMAAMPIYGKNLKKSSSPEPAGRFPRNLVCSIGDSCPS